MRQATGIRPIVVAAGLAVTVTIAFAMSTLDLAQAQDAVAPAGSVTPPPAAPGDEPASGGEPAPAPPASPVAPAGTTGSAPTPPVPDIAGSHSTSLGGSDIAVSSAGGSYEVDGPKRLPKRLPKVPERP